MTLSSELPAACGSYVGVGHGQESGPFDARIDVSPLPNGGAILAYRATSPSGETLHQESTMLSAGPDGLDRLYIAHSESPFITVMVEKSPGSGHFEQPEPFGPYAMEVVIGRPSAHKISYAWRWATQGDVPVEQSKADVRLAVT